MFKNPTSIDIPNISVIIPTFNRKVYLLESLAALARQTLPLECYEVIVVDDGSNDGTAQIAKGQFFDNLRYIRQENQGDATARNNGAQNSQAELLVFIDDDIIVDANYLEGLVRAHKCSPKRIVIGTMHSWLSEFDSKFHEIYGVAQIINRSEYPNFTEVTSNNMCIRREDYYELGGMRSLGFPGSDPWCDVDFAYRAFIKGYGFFRAPDAICYHNDYVMHSLENYKKRMRNVALQAAVLFQEYPELQSHLPMFMDKTPISWNKDPLILMIRKLVRHIASTCLALSSLEKIVSILEDTYASPRFLRPLYRWIIGGHIYQGYQAGLRRFGKSVARN